MVIFIVKLEVKYNKLSTIAEGETRHIAKGVFVCFCGKKLEHNNTLNIRDFFSNVERKGLKDVTCKKCKQLFLENEKNKEKEYNKQLKIWRKQLIEILDD